MLRCSRTECSIDQQSGRNMAVIANGIGGGAASDGARAARSATLHLGIVIALGTAAWIAAGLAVLRII